MLKIEKVEVYGFEAAIRGMRNPMNSHSKSDSGYVASGEHYENVDYVVGENDLSLMKRLAKAGRPHRKYLRMIHVSMDITAPDFFFKEFDTYRIGITENSTSTMHKLASRKLTIDDFSLEDMPIEEAEEIVRHNEERRLLYKQTGEEKEWRALIEGLPMSYNYRRTVDMNYENVLNIINQRTGHKLSEWATLIEELKKLPYISDLMHVNA